MNGVGIGDLANTRVRESKVVFFLGPARVLIQERETTAEGVRMKGVVWITEALLLFGVLYSTCVPCRV